LKADSVGKNRRVGKQAAQKVAAYIFDVLSVIPESTQEQSLDPKLRARELIGAAALRAAAISGTLALPPGPLGLLTILPDLVGIWRVQAQLVADIARTCGKTPSLTQEAMLYCLFRHAASHVLRDLVTRVGERVIFKRATLRAFQRMTRRVGITVTQRLAGKAVAQWVPLVGAVGIAAYAYYDTCQVGKTAIDLFAIGEG
jgi:hypothetical protein